MDDLFENLIRSYIHRNALEFTGRANEKNILIQDKGGEKKEALEKYGTESSGKNLPFSSLSDDLDKKKEK